MSEQFSIFKCDVCGNIVELLFAAGGEMSCCGRPMKLLTAGTSDGATEKHVPVLEATAEGCKVKVGSVPHPMQDTHWIEWIEVAAADGRRYKKFLNPGEAPEAVFPIPAADAVCVREYCNLHGLWKN